MRVFVHEDDLALEHPDNSYYKMLASGMPKRRWLPSQKFWKFPSILACMSYVHTYFPQASWTSDAQARFDSALAKARDRSDLAFDKIQYEDDLLEGVPFRLAPYRHQRQALLIGRDRAEFAYLMDQGTGKTKVILDDAAHNYRNGNINALLVISPNSVKTNWVNPAENPNDPATHDEVTKQMAPDIEYIKAAYFASPDSKQRRLIDQLLAGLKSPKLLILSTNVEGLHTEASQRMINKLVKARRTMIVVDESTRIGNRTAHRTKAIMKLRKFCPMARIASGTPVIKSPVKAFSQFNFLDPDILNCPTFTEFTARYCISNPKIPEHMIRFQNIHELGEKIAGCSYRVLKEDCLDLPPKVYTQTLVPMTQAMSKAYTQMRNDMIVSNNQGGVVLTAFNILTQVLRLQQITAGYLPVTDEFGEQVDQYKLTKASPPKIEEALRIIDETEGKVIVWCKFRFEIKEMAEALDKAGVNYVTFHGGTSEADRVSHRQGFLNDPELKVFVGQTRTGGVGLNLQSARTVIYLSNTFSTEDRVQSEDRAHRIGTIGSVQYIDLVSPGTVDERILSVLRSNKRMSDEIMRDGYRAWI